MSTTLHSGMNGRLKKSLAFQLDRLDTILDGLADALNGAVADAVRQSVETAAREAVKVALAEALPQAAAEKATTTAQPVKGLMAQATAKVKQAVNWFQNLLVSTYQKIKLCFNRHAGATVQSAQTAFATVRSRTMRVGMMLGALFSCIVGFFRKDSQKLWWGIGLVLTTMFLESSFGTLGTLLLGGGVLYLSRHSLIKDFPEPVLARQAA